MPQSLQSLMILSVLLWSQRSYLLKTINFSFWFFLMMRSNSGFLLQQGIRASRIYMKTSTLCAFSSIRRRVFCMWPGNQFMWSLRCLMTFILVAQLCFNYNNSTHGIRVIELVGVLKVLLKIRNIINLSMKTVHLSTFLLLSCLMVLSFAWQYNNPNRLTASLAVVKQDWIDQLIDHLNYNSRATFKQRYYVLQDYYLPSGPAYLYICGEAECRGISNSSWLAEIARQTHGVIFALEHRYYGKSLPFGNDSMSLENLKYLNSEQGLSDLAYFISYIKSNKLYGVQPSTSWITVGGSYAGAMSAWFRAKYPHLTVGAVGSSGVVLAVEDFKAFDEQIYQSALKSGPECVAAIQDLNKYVEDIINSDGRLAFQAQFKAEKLTVKEFLFYWADVGVLQFQYSKRVEFCASISGKSREEVFSVFKAIALTVTPVDYGAFYLKNASFAIEDGSGARAWIYQSCTEFSYFQTYSDHPMRSLQLDLDFYKSWCADIFGVGVWPFVSRVNNQFGGLTLEATNLYMSNGDQDPWRWAGLQKSRKDIIAKVYVCPDCGHCADLAGPKQTDADTLKAVRAQQFASIKKWLAEAESKRKVIIQ